MHNNGAETSKIRIEINIDKNDKRTKNMCIPPYLDLPRPDNGMSYSPHEMWDIFHDINTKFGDEIYKWIKRPLLTKLTTNIDNNKPLVPIRMQQAYKCINKPRNKIEQDWNLSGRKRLAALSNVTNLIYEKAKSNPGLEIPETEIEKIIRNEMSEKSNVNNYTPSPRTMKRYKNEVKVESVLCGNFSITKAGVKKDMHRYTSENSLRNALSYLITVLSTHFILGEDLEPNIYEKLSDDAKNTIELVKKLNNVDKARPIPPEQILGSDDTSLFAHTGSVKKNE